MKWPELQSILVKELRNSENHDQGISTSTRPKVYETIDDAIRPTTGRTIGKTAVSTPRKQIATVDENKLFEENVPLSRSNPIPIPIPRRSIRRNKPAGGVAPISLSNPTKTRYDNSPDKAISPTTSPNKYSYQQPMTQLHKSGLWSSTHITVPNVHVSSHVEPPPSENPQLHPEHKADAFLDTTIDRDEDLYLKPDGKEVLLLTRARKQSGSVKQVKVNNKVPTPPKRSASFMTRRERALLGNANIASGDHINWREDAKMHESGSKSHSLTALHYTERPVKPLPWTSDSEVEESASYPTSATISTRPYNH